MLHPFMPFLTEELWAIKGEQGPPRDSVLALADWSDLSDFNDASAEEEVGWVVDLVSEVRSVRSEMNVPAASQIPLALITSPESPLAARAKRWETAIKGLARVSDMTFESEAPEKAVQIIVRGHVVALLLAGIIDFAAERTRLTKEIARINGDADKIEIKLGNADFIARAPEEVIEEQRERLADMTSRRAKLETALARIGA
jgi:valyl-tRNA synthetase